MWKPSSGGIDIREIDGHEEAAPEYEASRGRDDFLNVRCVQLWIHSDPHYLGVDERQQADVDDEIGVG